MLRSATSLHRTGKFEEAIEAYRKVVAVTDEPAPSILLANLLVSAPAPSATQGAARRVQAAALAERAIAQVDTLPAAKQKAALYARHGYFLLQMAGAFPSANAGASAGAASGQGDDEEEGAVGLDEASAVLVSAATTSLEKASQLDPSVVIAWRNLALAYKAAKREADVEGALRQAIAHSPTPSAELLYRHSKALKAVKNNDAATLRLLDVLAADPTHTLAAFWLRVALADSEKAKLSPEVAEKVAAYVASHPTSAASGGVAAAGGAAAATEVLVPHDYIRRLFDSYSSKFDEHLTLHLGYQTPKVLLALALEACDKAGARADAAGRLWRRCADLGCGTGLAGVEFRPLVSHLAGVDLSGGMVAEAHKRALYDELAVDSCEGWLEAQTRQRQSAAADGADSAAERSRLAAAEGGAPESGACAPYDLVVAADVFVYIGDLRAVVAGTAQLMRGAEAGGAGVPPLFIFSTEADLAAEAAEAAAGSAGGAACADISRAGFRLTGTGRCVHSRRYILALVAEHGFSPLSVTRRPIRQNAGVDVMGDLFVLRFDGGTAAAP